MAYITFPGGAVVCRSGGRIFDVLSLVRLNLFVGDDAMWVAVSGRSVKIVDEVDVTVRRRGWIQDVSHGVRLDPRREWGRSAVGRFCLRYPSLDALVIHSRRVLQDLGCVVGDDGRLSIV